MKYRIIVKRKYRSDTYPYSVERRTHWFWRESSERYSTVEYAEQAIRRDIQDIQDKSKGLQSGVVKYYTEQDMVADKLKGVA
jgi:hypothetical protein